MPKLGSLHLDDLSLGAWHGHSQTVLFQPVNVKLYGLADQAQHFRARSPTATQPGRSGTWAPQLVSPRSITTMSVLTRSYAATLLERGDDFSVPGVLDEQPLKLWNEDRVRQLARCLNGQDGGSPTKLGQHSRDRVLNLPLCEADHRFTTDCVV